MPDKKPEPKIAVVTLNWNGLHDTIECLESLAKSKYPHYTIVVDNGSTDGSAKVLADKYKDKIHLIRNKTNLGYSRGMNAGLIYAFTECQADYCLVMNNDTIVDPNVIPALLETAERHSDAGFVTGKVYYYDNPDILQTVGKKYDALTLNGGHIGRNEKDEGQFESETELAFCDDIFWLVKRKLWETTGGYDPEFFLQAEDFEWQLRAREAGFKIYYTPSAKIWHKESMKLGKMSPLKLFYDVRNPVIAVLKHMDKAFCRKYFIYHLKEKVAIPLIKNLVKMRFKHAGAIVAGFCSFLVWLFLFKSGLK